ncbi:MAG: hypothetical protein HYZ36_06660 [Pedosphaera parvula]|nr:hypothetical protein [Pedosphaera parvula]
MNAIASQVRQIPPLLRGDTECIDRWLQRREPARAALYVAVVVAGAGLYGLAMGSWRAPEQAVFTALKLPLVVLLTTLGNALLNGLLAPLLGLNLSFRQTSFAILMSFAIAATILGAFSPLVWFLVWNTPATSAYSFTLVIQVLVIAYAGIMANLRLAQLLEHHSGSRRVARRVLCAWLAGNLFLGSQLSWILRPFIGSPDLPVEFLRTDAFRGNFYEAVFFAIRHLFSS